MTIHLPPELEQLLCQQLDSGKYHSATEVLRDALQLLGERERREQQLAALRAQVAVGIEQADRGELIESDQIFDELEENLRNRLRNSK